MTSTLVFAVALVAISHVASAQVPSAPVMSPAAPGLVHAEIRDTSVDALPHVSIPVSPDLVLAVVDVGNADVAFKFRFRPGSFDPSTTRIVVDLDIDQNAASGTAGIEYQVFVVPARGQADVVQTLKPSVSAGGGAIPDVVAGIVPVSCVEDGCDVTIPRRLLGDDDGRFDFRVRIYVEPAQLASPIRVGAKTVIDVLPDIGMVRVQ